MRVIDSVIDSQTINRVAGIVVVSYVGNFVLAALRAYIVSSTNVPDERESEIGAKRGERVRATTCIDKPIEFSRADIDKKRIDRN